MLCSRSVTTHSWHTVHFLYFFFFLHNLSQLMRLWYLSHRRPAKAQAGLRVRAVSPEPSLFAHIKYSSRRRFWPTIRHLAPLDVCTCAFEEWIYGGQKVPKISLVGSYSSFRPLAAQKDVDRCFCGQNLQLKPLLPFEPNHEKTCLRGARPGKLQTNLISRRSKVPYAESWNFTFSKLKYYICVYTILAANNKGADHSARICAFVVRISHKQAFSWRDSWMLQWRGNKYMYKDWNSLGELLFHCIM